MSFKTEKNKPASQKIVLVELDLSVTIGDPFINFEAGIWFNILWRDPDRGSSNFTLYGTYATWNVENVRYNIASLRVDQQVFTRVTSLSDLRIQNKSFYFNLGDQILYIHFDQWAQPLGKDIAPGNVHGFCNQIDQQTNDAYYEDVYYAPRILSIPSMTKSKDPLFFGVLKYQGGSVSLNNQYGFFDEFNDLDIYGQSVRIKLGFAGFSYAQFRQVYEGYVETAPHDWKTFTLNIQDKRKLLERTIPIRLFSDTDYPDITEDMIGEIMPLAYGKVKNTPCTCLNEYGAAPYVFMFIDTIDHSAVALTTVYIEGAVIVPANIDLTTGTFELSAAQCFDGTTLLEITADFTGANISNGQDVIKDLLLIYLDMSFISANFNLVEWNIEQLTTRDVGIWIGEEIKVIEVIQKICVAVSGIFTVEDNGTYSFRKYDYNRIPTRQIEDDEWLDEPKFADPSQEFLSSVKIQYFPDQTDDKIRKSVTNKDYEAEVLTRYKTRKQKTILTCLVTEAEALAKSEDIMDRSKEITEEVTRKTKTQNIDLEIMKFIICNHLRASETPDFKVYEIIKIGKELSKAEISLTMKYVKDYIETETCYIQGVGWGDRGFGDRGYSVTNFEEVTI